MGTGKVLLGNINPGLVTSAFMRSVIRFMQYDSANRQVFRGFLPWEGALLDMNRNLVCQQFLDDADYEWLWFVDSDIEIENDTLYTLLDTASPDECPVVSGVYTTINRDGASHPCLYYRGVHEERQKLTMLPYFFDTLPPGIVIEVDGCGAGNLLIHRSLLDAMSKVYPAEKPWFDMGVFDGVPYGEDFTFCMRVKQMGFPITVNTLAQTAHYKTVKVVSPTMEKVNATVD